MDLPDVLPHGWDWGLRGNGRAGAKAPAFFVCRLDPAKFRSEDGGMKRASGRGGRTPWRFRASTGRGLRRCADDHGHLSGELQMATPNGRRGLLEAYSQLVTDRRHSMKRIDADCHDPGICGREAFLLVGDVPCSDLFRSRKPLQQLVMNAQVKRQHLLASVQKDPLASRITPSRLHGPDNFAMALDPFLTLGHTSFDLDEIA
jgi:hypothetical protein